MLSVVQTAECYFRLCDYFSFSNLGQVPILRSIQYVTFKYGDFQKASRIYLRERSIFINSALYIYLLTLSIFNY